MNSQKQFEDRVFETVRTILGQDAPNQNVLRNPRPEASERGRGRKYRFHGLTQPQCEQIKLPSGREGITPLTNLGLHLLAYHHRDCRLGVFAGDFVSYVVAHLHQHYAWAGQSADIVAALYGLDPMMVERAANIYRRRRNVGTREALSKAFASGTIGQLIERDEESQALIARIKREQALKAEGGLNDG